MNHLFFHTRFISLIAVLLLLSGCKSNTRLSRCYNALNTRFNTYFNGYEAYKEGLKTMEEKHEEEYSERIWIHPVCKLVGQKGSVAGGQFDRSIEKCKMAIQRRSITKKPKRHNSKSEKYKKWLTHGEFNPYMHNCWLLSGKAEFYKGDFNAAAATFDYTARRFWWRKYTVYECQIWIARIYAIQGYTFDAETRLGTVIPLKQFTTQAELAQLPAYREMRREMQQAFSIAMAEIKLSRPETAVDAIDFLQAGRNGFFSHAQRLRCDYLVSQLLAERGDYKEAFHRFGKLGHSGTDYKTQFNAKMAQINALSHFNNPSDKQLHKIEQRFNRMRIQARNEDYLDQIYHSLGNIALLRGDTALAIERLEKALEKSTRGGMDKALAALRLGEITFGREEYLKAQKAYSTAMGILKEDFKGYEALKTLSNVLDELKTHAETVETQDSLLRLADLPKEELDKEIQRMIRETIKRERAEREAEQIAEYESKKNTTVDPLASTDTDPMLAEEAKQDNSWYFYNPALVAAGKTAFQRVWGARKPEDDWRRRNKTETSLFDDSLAEESSTADTAATATETSSPDAPSQDAPQQEETAAATPSDDVNDPHKPAYYLAQIPFSPEQKATAEQLVEEGMYNMGMLIDEKLENFPLAIRTFEHLETRFPESSHRPDIYHACYLMCQRMADRAEREGKTDEAAVHYAASETWRQKLLTSFPTTPYGLALRDPHYIENLRQMVHEQDTLYEQTYAHYLAGHTTEVHQNYAYVSQTWPLSTLLPKFLFLHALSYVQEGQAESYKNALDTLTSQYPTSDVAPLASQMQKGMREGKQLQFGGQMRSMVWNTSLHQASDTATVGEKGDFIIDENVPHLLLFLVHTDSLPGLQNNLLFEIAKFNFENYLVRDFDLEVIDIEGGVSVIIVSGFETRPDLLDYRTRLENSASFEKPRGVHLVDISDQNFRQLLAGRTLDEYFTWAQSIYGDLDPELAPPPSPEADVMEKEVD